MTPFTCTLAAQSLRGMPAWRDACGTSRSTLSRMIELFWLHGAFVGLADATQLTERLGQCIH